MFQALGLLDKLDVLPPDPRRPTDRAPYLPRPSTLRATVDLPPVARSAAAARRLVAQMLEAWAAESFC